VPRITELTVVAAATISEFPKAALISGESRTSSYQCVERSFSGSVPLPLASNENRISVRIGANRKARRSQQ
jgi:hypothetical protein